MSDWWQDPNHEFTVYMTKDGKVDIDIASNVIKHKADIYQALGGLGCLIKRGVFNDGISSIGTYLCDTHPRTAIGLSEDKQTLYVVVVDGRRTNYAEGLDIYELADFMWGIGSYDAVNYDGGGSSTMVCGTKMKRRRLRLLFVIVLPMVLPELSGMDWLS